MATRSNNAATDSLSNKILNQWLPSFYNNKAVKTVSEFAPGVKQMSELYTAAGSGSASDIANAQRKVVGGVVLGGLLGRFVNKATAKIAKPIVGAITKPFMSEAEKFAQANITKTVNQSAINELRKLTTNKVTSKFPTKGIVDFATQGTISALPYYYGIQGINKVLAPSVQTAYAPDKIVYPAANPGTPPPSIVANPSARPTGPVTATKPGTKATITNSNATTGGTSSGSTAAGNTTDNSAAAWAAAREKELADMKKLADAKSATPSGTNNSTGNTAGTTTDQGGTITMDMTQTDQAANAASAAAQASYNAGLASLAQQSYANQIALRDALATNMQQSQGQAADIYGGTAPALLGQFITGDQRGYVQGVSGETQRSVTQQNALLQAYNDNVAQIAQAKANAYASAAAKKAALAAQIRANG